MESPTPESDPAEILLPEFARAFAVRAPRVAILLGAGASVSSGVPSAAQLVWDFKRTLYSTENGIHSALVGSVADPLVRESLQRYFAGKPEFPPAGDESEYSFYFERAYPDPKDRRLLINQRLGDRKPAYGYLCLAALMAKGLVRLAWTPNFDTLAEQAFGAVSTGESVSLVGLDTSSRLPVYLRDERYPILVKLHGDFRFDALRNTEAELARGDDQLRRELVEQSRTYGLVVVGYSGRDASIMDALLDACREHGNRAFPEGLYWCVRDGETYPSRASELLTTAAASGVRCAFVRISDFDDFAANLYKACGVQHPLVDAQLAERQKTRAGYPVRRAGKLEPLLKLNGIPIESFPTSCYRFGADIESWKQLRETVGPEQIVAGLHSRQVWAMGAREDIQRVFEPSNIRDLQPASIVDEDLRAANSVLLGLLYQALVASLTTNSPLGVGGGGRDARLLYLRKDARLGDELLRTFRNLGLQSAAIPVRRGPGGDYWIHEAAQVALDFRESQLWLLFLPTVFLTVDGTERWDDPSKTDVVRELLVHRYNRQSSQVFNFWLRLLHACTDNGVLRFPKDREIGFEFRLTSKLAVSYRHP